MVHNQKQSSRLDRMAQRDNAAWRIQHYLQQRDNAAAADLAFMQIDNAIENPRLALMCMLAFARAGDLIHAVDLAEEWMSRDMAPDLALRVAQTLLDAGRGADALAVARQALLQHGGGSSRMHFLMAQALLACEGDEADALPYLEEAYRQSPDDLPILRLYGDVLLQAGRYDDAVTVLSLAAMKAPELLNIQHLYARALKHARRYDEASDVLLAASRLGGGSEKSKRIATSALLQAGREHEACDLYQEFLVTRQQRLCPSFREELDALYERLGDAQIPQSRFDWAWQISTRAMGRKPAEDRAQWEQQARWGLLSDAALMDWLECCPDRYGELVAELDDIEAVGAIAREALAYGKGVLFAAAHVGPMFAGPLVLHQNELPNKWLSSTPRISTTTYAESLISTSDQTETQVARRIKESLAEGNIVTLAVDGAMSPTAPRIEWHGASITYSDFTAIMAYRAGCPSLYVTPYWNENRRISFSLDWLPMPQEGEALRDFTVRWRESYFAGIMKHLARGPENLRLTGGIWRHV